jgi:hypothetical protein
LARSPSGATFYFNYHWAAPGPQEGDGPQTILERRHTEPEPHTTDESTTLQPRADPAEAAGKRSQAEAPNREDVRSLELAEAEHAQPSTPHVIPKETSSTVAVPDSNRDAVLALVPTISASAELPRKAHPALYAVGIAFAAYLVALFRMDDTILNHTTPYIYIVIVLVSFLVLCRSGTAERYLQAILAAGIATFISALAVTKMTFDFAYMNG